MAETHLSAYGGDTRRTFDATGFFRLERTDERWWLVDPDGAAFISIGVNHADESNLKYPHNRDIWKEKYGSRESWIRDGVVKDFREWGFNTIGWTQEYISGDWGVALDWFGDPIDLGHSSAPWPAADFRTADMPYVILLRGRRDRGLEGPACLPRRLSPRFRRLLRIPGTEHLPGPCRQPEPARLLLVRHSVVAAPCERPLLRGLRRPE